MAVRVVYSTDPDPLEQCPRCGRVPCVCNKIDLAPRQQTAYVQRDRKRRAGKTVTVISGLQHNPASFKDLLKALQTACGTGGTVKEGRIEIQGDKRAEVARILLEANFRPVFAGG